MRADAHIFSVFTAMHAVRKFTNYRINGEKQGQHDMNIVTAIIAMLAIYKHVNNRRQ